MKKKESKKSRADIIEWVSDGVVSSISFEFDQLDGTIKLNQADLKQTKLKRVYSRDSGKEKILSSIVSNSNVCSFNSDAILKKTFDHLIAIDTNTKLHAGKSIAIATAYYVENELKSYDSMIPYEHLCSYIITGLAKEDKAEAIGWYLTLKNKINYRHFKNKTLGIVVDSELGNHEAINSREIPFYFRYLLPREFKLIYASDASSDLLPNQMIRFCDKANNQIFKHINPRLEKLIPSILGVIDGSNCKYADVSPRKAIPPDNSGNC